MSVIKDARFWFALVGGLGLGAGTYFEIDKTMLNNFVNIIITIMAAITADKVVTKYKE